ncbi:MAG: glycoside hydrolase [Clostridiales bacterium]|nr:glycoside hydrolase [Clostridiales bacterium]
MKRTDINIRDPYVLVHGGRYYLYGTRGETCWGPASGFDVYVSGDLEEWSGPHEVFRNDGSFWADRNYWAPEVHLYRGAFYMFASFKRDGLRRGTAILRSDSPMGPFRPHSGGCVTPAEWECLDGTLYLSPEGTPYMVFCHEWVQAGDGEICAMRLTDDLRAPAGEPWLLFRASEASWCKVMRHSSGVEGCVTDGPFFWRTENGTLLCLWASFSQGGYTEAVAVSDNGGITGRFTQAEPLFMDDGGHGMVFRALDGQLYLTLHSPNEHLLERPHFHPIEEKNGTLIRKN